MIFKLRTWWLAAREAWRVWRQIGQAQKGANHFADEVVPMRHLEAADRPAVQAHLLALSTEDRYLRFGYHASNEQIRHYVDHLDFERDEIYGIFNRKLALIAMAHLAAGRQPQVLACAEFGVSVLAHARGRGYGGQLFARAVMHARNAGVGLLFIHALSENRVMLQIARKAGAQVDRDGGESEAYLKLPEASMDTRVVELLEDHMADTDYQLKVQAKHFWDFLADVQEVRQGVREGRHRASS
jgi:GNAT superfamily N-acetyltransferase